MCDNNRILGCNTQAGRLNLLRMGITELRFTNMRPLFTTILIRLAASYCDFIRFRHHYLLDGCWFDLISAVRSAPIVFDIRPALRT